MISREEAEGHMKNEIEALREYRDRSGKIDHDAAGADVSRRSKRTGLNFTYEAKGPRSFEVVFADGDDRLVATGLVGAVSMSWS